MTLKETIEKLTNTRDYENLKEILGKDLGTLLYQVVNAAEKADKELDILHNLITEVYNDDHWHKKVKAALDSIDTIKKTELP